MGWPKYMTHFEKFPSSAHGLDNGHGDLTFECKFVLTNMLGKLFFEQYTQLEGNQYPD